MALKKIITTFSTNGVDKINNEAEIANDFDELYFDTDTDTILMPDRGGMKEVVSKKVGTPAAVSDFKVISGYVNAGSFVTLDNIKATVTTSGLRGLSVASVAGTFQALISATFGFINGVGGSATNGGSPPTYNITPSASIFGWSFPNAGDGSVYLINDITNKRFYRITLMIGPGYNSNFISIERLY